MKNNTVAELYERRDYSRASFDQDLWKPSKLISITSQSKVGKTTLTTLLMKHLPFHFVFVSAGSIMRKEARKRGMLVEDFAQYIREHPEEGIDEFIDNEIRTMARKHEHLLSEGRLSHINLPFAYKVLLTCPHSVRVERHLKDLREKDRKNGKKNGKENGEHHFEDIFSKILMRDVDDETRYEPRYPGCIWDKEDFDLVLDTSVTPPEKECRIVLCEYEKWLMNQKYTAMRYGITVSN